LLLNKVEGSKRVSGCENDQNGIGNNKSAECELQIADLLYLAFIELGVGASRTFHWLTSDEVQRKPSEGIQVEERNG